MRKGIKFAKFIKFIYIEFMFWHNLRREQRMKSWQKLFVAVVVLIFIAFLGGCAREVEEVPIYKPPAEKKAPEYSLKEVEQESLSALTLGAISPFSEDVTLTSLGAYKEKLPRPERIENPKIEIFSPQNGDYLANEVTVKTWVTPGTNPVKEVKFFVDGVQRGSVSSPPYQWSWDLSKEARTEHTLRVVVTDGENESSDEVKVYVVVDGSIGLKGEQYSKSSGSVKVVDYYDPNVGDYTKGLLVEADENTPAWAIYCFTPPHSFKYLQGVITLNGTSLSGDEPTLYVYNWSSGSYENKVYDYETKEYGSEIAGTSFGFPYFEPGGNVIWAKVFVPTNSRFRVESLNLNFKYVYDNTAPSISGVSARISGGTLKIGYHLSEEAFVTVYIYDSSNRVIATLKRPDPLSYNWMEWNVPSSYEGKTLKYRIKAVDSAGHSTITSFKSINVP
jgi:predicted small lipoprotein YifL